MKGLSPDGIVKVKDKLSLPNPPAAHNEVLLYQFSWTHVLQGEKDLLILSYYFSPFVCLASSW